MLDVFDRAKESGYFLAAQNYRQFMGHSDRLHLGHHVRALKGGTKEKCQPSDHRIERDGCGAGANHMQLETAQVFGAGGIR